MTTAVVKREIQERVIDIQRKAGVGRAEYKFTPPLRTTGLETPMIVILFGSGQNCQPLRLSYNELRDLLVLLSETVQQFQKDLPPSVAINRDEQPL